MDDLGGMDPAARRFLAMVGLGTSPDVEVDIAARRTSFERLMRFSRPPSVDVATRDTRIPIGDAEIPMRVYRAAATVAEGGLIYFHGGGLVAGSIATHDALCRSLAVESGATILSVGYRLAPEHPFPIPILDALAAARHVLGNRREFGLAADTIAVGGDSGGATLAAVIAREMPHAFRAQVLLCPVLDFAGDHESRQLFGDGFLLDAVTMKRDLAHYAPDCPLADPRVSPMQAERFDDLPQAIVHTAGFDPLRDEGAAYAARLAEAGVDVVYTCHDRLIHHFYGLTAVIPAAVEALASIGADLRRVVAGSTRHGGVRSR